MSVSGKVCIITGASRGIGSDVAVALGGEGANVVIASRSETQTDPRMPGDIYQVAERVEKAGGKALPIKCDVSKDEDIDNVVEKTMSTFGRIDMLMNNAAIQVPGDSQNFQPRHLDLIYRVDLRAPIMFIRQVLPHMIKGGGGHIINISSRGGVFPGPGPYQPLQGPAGNSFYGMVKSGLERYSQGLAREVQGHNISVNVISPDGRIKTPGSAWGRENAGKKPEEMDLDFEHADEMAKAIIWIMNQEPQKYTGNILFDKIVVEENKL